MRCFTKFTEKQALGSATLLKRDASIGAFLWILQFFKKHLVYRTIPVAASGNTEQQQLCEGYASFANSCYKIVSPIPHQEPINDFAVGKHCSGTLLRSNE